MKYIITLILSVLSAVPAFAKTFTVTSTADLTAGGASGVCETAPGNGVCTLRAAIQVANALAGPDTIVLPPGTYTLTIAGQAEDAAASGDLDITDNLTIIGADAATTIVQACAPIGAATICTGIDRVFHVDPTGKLVSAAISGVTIQNGTTTLISFVNAGGGAIRLGHPQTLGDLVPSGRLTLSHCVVRNSQSPRAGGGIAVNAGTLTLINTTVSGNSAGNGGGIALSDFSTTDLSGSTVSNNLADQGGGIFVGDFDISIGSTQLTINNSTISNNQGNVAGGIFRNRGAFNMTNSTLSGNSAHNGGGGIADSGVNNGPSLLNNVTITKNSGSGIRSGGGPLTIQNSIIAGNVPGFFGGGPDCNGTLNSAGHNLIQDLTGCAITGDTASNILGKDPQLTILGNNGGTGLTHAIPHSSPAADAGSPAVPGTGGTACATTDARGVARPQGPRCDIGAFEFKSGFAVTGMLPDHAGNSGSISALLFGGSFTSATSVKLRCGGTDIPGGSVSIDASGSIITTRFDLGGISPTRCDLIATNPDSSSVTRTGAFTVQLPTAAQLWAQIISRSQIRIGGRTRIRIAYGNNGNTDALGVALGISLSSNLGQSAFFPVGAPPPQPGDLPTDWRKVTVGAVSKRAGRTFIPLLLPIVPTGFTGIYEFTVAPAPAVHGQFYSIEASIGPATVAPDFTPDPIMLKNLIAGAKSYAKRFLNTTIPSAKDPQLTAYYKGLIAKIVRDGCSPLDGKPNPPFVYSVCSLSQMIVGGTGNGAGKPGPAPGNGGGGGGDGGGGNAGADPGDDPPDCDDLGWCDEPPSPPPCAKWPPTACGGVAPGGGPITGSIDPNDKVGPLGVTASRFIASASPLGYAVFFENLATATAPAQKIIVTDQLNPALVDLSTFSFGPVTFGTNTALPTSGLSAFTQDVDLRPAQKLIARIAATLNQSTGLVTWTLSSFDPITLRPTEDPAAGILPPNAAPPAGEGSVAFSVRSKSGLETGAQLPNHALVVFDSNVSIATPTWTNTIDTAAPSSKVSALPTSQSRLSFPVQWSGTDTGAGIQSFTVYVSDNNGPFTTFQANATSTSATFTGQRNHTYGFYSVASDLVGNVEAAKTVADTTTKLIAGVGDLNGDGVVNCADLVIVRVAFGKKTGQIGFDSRADLNGDGVVNVLDLSMVAKQISAGTSCH